MRRRSGAPTAKAKDSPAARQQAAPPGSESNRTKRSTRGTSGGSADGIATPLPNWAVAFVAAALAAALYANTVDHDYTFDDIVRSMSTPTCVNVVPRCAGEHDVFVLWHHSIVCPRDTANLVQTRGCMAVRADGWLRWQSTLVSVIL